MFYMILMLERINVFYYINVCKNFMLKKLDIWYFLSKWYLMVYLIMFLNFRCV